MDSPAWRIFGFLLMAGGGAATALICGSLYDARSELPVALGIPLTLLLVLATMMAFFAGGWIVLHPGRAVGAPTPGPRRRHRPY